MSPRRFDIREGWVGEDEPPPAEAPAAPAPEPVGTPAAPTDGETQTEETTGDETDKEPEHRGHRGRRS